MPLLALSLCSCQTLEAKGIETTRGSQTRFDRVIRDVIPTLLEALLIENLHLGITALPYFAEKIEFLRKAMGKSALDQLHCLFDRHRLLESDQQMHMIRHDDEVLEFKFLLPYKRPKNVDKKIRISLRLQQATAHVGSGGREEGSDRAGNILR